MSLRDAIVTGRLRPGDRLTETELAHQLGTSRAPVREALRQLEYEGLVANSPYRTTEVLGISQEEIERVLVPVRLTLELFAFRKALPRLDDDDLAALERLVRLMRHTAAEGDANALAEADVRFHELIIARAGQTHCLQLWRMIEPRVRAHFRRDAPKHPDRDEVPNQHEWLLAVLSRGDETEVLAELERHINAFLLVDHQDDGAGTSPPGRPV